MHERTPRRLSSAELQTAIEIACDKLVVISETDSPVEPFLDGSIDDISIRAVAYTLARKPAEAVEQIEFQTFFEKLTREREWHGAAQKKLARRFAELERLLRENLDDPSVFRFGTIRIDIFIVGRDADGHLAGVRTMMVET